MKDSYSIKRIKCHVNFCLTLLNILFPLETKKLRCYLRFSKGSHLEKEYRIYNDLTISICINSTFDQQFLERKSDRWESILFSCYENILDLEDRLLNMIIESCDVDKVKKYGDEFDYYI